MVENINEIAVDVPYWIPIYSPDYWVSRNGTTFKDASWLIPGVPHERGGVVRNYSQVILNIKFTCLAYS